ncbi:MAG: hypothetical protein INR73_02505 [Williamsia sp.]|nr:hypothetical protein [Williamsia sp.]
MQKATSTKTSTMRSILSGPLFLLCLCCLLPGCVNLKKVNDYSAGSLKSLKKFEEIGYTFNRACLDRCELEQLRSLRLRAGDCNCSLDQQADSIALLIYNSVKGYFEGMTRISDGKVTDYKPDALTKALKEGSFGDLKIGKEEVDSYAAISTILLRATTDIYRKKKISKYIEEANGPVQVLLSAMDFNLAANLNGKLNVRKQRLENIYVSLVNDSLASLYDKTRAIEDYNSATRGIELRQKQLTTFSKGLKTIAAGHQQLYDSRNKITVGELKELLTQYASDLQNIVDEFNKLKNQS